MAGKRKTNLGHVRGVFELEAEPPQNRRDRPLEAPGS